MSTPNQPGAAVIPTRVSVLSRLVPCLSYAIPALAGMLGSFLVIRTFEAMRNAETAGVAAIAGGLAESNLPVLVASYLAIVLGAVGIVVAIVRSQMSTTTASASAWFFLVAGGLGLLSPAFLWQAESTLLHALTTPGGNVSSTASSVQQCLSLATITGLVIPLLLLIAAVVPLPAILRARRSYPSLIILVVMELALIGMTVCFQVRTSWLHQVRLQERF